MSKNPLKVIIGKKIKNAEIEKTEASDGCQFATMILTFDDDSVYSLRFMAQPAVYGIFFKDENDDNATETTLVKP